MRYRKFGNTRLDISVLGFGCMRLPMKKIGDKDFVEEDKTIEMIRRAYELGVNYYDSAYFYCGGQSETVLGKALKGIRDKVIVSTKSPGHLVKKPGDYTRILEEQLTGCEYCMPCPAGVNIPHIFKATQKLQIREQLKESHKVLHKV